MVITMKKTTYSSCAYLVTISNTIAELRKKMWRTNFWFHFVRNNPRHRDQHYARLIAAVGYENWRYVEPTLRMSWESARNSFDKMYGLIKAFDANNEIYTKLFAEAETERQKAEAEEKKKKEEAEEAKKNQPNPVDYLLEKLKDISPEEKARLLREVNKNLGAATDGAKQLRMAEEMMRVYERYQNRR